MTFGMQRLARTKQGIGQAIEQIQALVDDLECDDTDRFQLLTCCREALNNVLEHARGTTFQMQTRLFQFVRSRQVVFCLILEQSGYGRPPCQEDEMPLNSLAGRGWLIMDAWMDRLYFDNSADLSRLYLLKRLKASCTPLETLQSQPSPLKFVP